MRYGAPPSLDQPPLSAEYCAKIAFPPYVRTRPAVAAIAELVLAASSAVACPPGLTSVVPPKTWHDVVSQMSWSLLPACSRSYSLYERAAMAWACSAAAGQLLGDSRGTTPFR